MIFALALVACSDTQLTSEGAPQQTQVADAEMEDEHPEEEGDDHDEAETDHDEAEADHDDEGEVDEHAHVEVPHEYEDLVNPLEGDSEALVAGAAVYATTRASCHRETGMGDGAAAEGLDPKPASFADEHMMSEMTDGYLNWRIELGGAMEPFNSAVPAWGEAYSEDQIWQLVAFIRTLPAE